MVKIIIDSHILLTSYFNIISFYSLNFLTMIYLFKINYLRVIILYFKFNFLFINKQDWYLAFPIIMEILLWLDSLFVPILLLLSNLMLRIEFIYLSIFFFSNCHKSIYIILSCFIVDYIFMYFYIIIFRIFLNNNLKTSLLWFMHLIFFSLWFKHNYYKSQFLF